MPPFVRLSFATVAAVSSLAAAGAVSSPEHVRGDGRAVFGYVAANPSPAVSTKPAQPKRAKSKSVAQPAKRSKTPKRKPARKPQLPPAPTTVIPNDPLWQQSWSLAKVEAPAAWHVTTGSAETVVAVVDTGIDPDHPDLQGALVPGWNAVHENANTADDHGHGTGVAGVIAARADNGIGGAGACWRCSLMPIKVISAAGTGTAADIAEGIVWAADHGAHVINLSFVMSGSDAGVAAAIEHARAKGAIVVAAAGNSGGADMTFPAGQPGVVSVTATDSSDGRYGWATFGGWVSVAAPGCSQSTVPGGAYGEFCGTSSAAAFVSGVVSLVRSYVPGVAAAAIVDAVSTQAVPVGPFVSSGRIQARAALDALDAIRLSSQGDRTVEKREGPPVAGPPSFDGVVAD